MEYDSNRYIQGLNRPLEYHPHRRYEPRQVLIVLTGILAFLGGFVPIFVLTNPASKNGPSAQKLVQSAAVASSVTESLLMVADTEVVDGEDVVEDEGDALPDVPPGPTPKGIWIKSDPLYLKCWDSSGGVHSQAGCDTLGTIEKRLKNRLYLVHRCKSRHASAAEGILSLGMQVDFEKKITSFWSGPSSTLENAQQIGTCVRNQLTRFPIGEARHRNVRYRIFFTIEFRDPQKLAAEIEKKRKRGRMVNVIKDRVRVRREPENGYVLGNIGTGNQVTLLKRQAKWCQVITPADREGWMICEALDI